MALDNPAIQKPDYAKGALYGYEGLHEAVKIQQDGHCLLCKKDIGHFHHIVPKSKGGSNTIANIAGLCTKCHEKVHKDSALSKRLLSKKAGLNKKYGALSVLNQIIPFLLKGLEERYPDAEIVATAGYITKYFRDYAAISKDHDNDAYCIACSALNIEDICTFSAGRVTTQEIMQFRRQDRMACHKEMADRTYVDETGKAVCKNRRKAMGQTTDSLEEYRQEHTQQKVSRLRVEEHKPQYKNTRRVMPGSIIRYTSIPAKEQEKAGITGSQTVFVLKRTDGKHDGRPDYFVGMNGKKYPFSRCGVKKSIRSE